MDEKPQPRFDIDIDEVGEGQPKSKNEAWHVHGAQLFSSVPPKHLFSM